MQAIQIAKFNSLFSGVGVQLIIETAHYFSEPHKWMHGVKDELDSLTGLL